MMGVLNSQVYNIPKNSKMKEGNLKHKPIDQDSVKARLILTQVRIQQSFKQPLKYLTSLLSAIVYIQCLKYPIDIYSSYWFAKENVAVFRFLDISSYSNDRISKIISFSFAIVHCVYSVLLIVAQKRIKKLALFMSAKFMQLALSSVFFMWVIGDACTVVSDYFYRAGQPTYMVILAITSLVLFAFIIVVQTFVRFDFIAINTTNGVIRTSNWSNVALLLYIVVNQLTSKLSDISTSIHLITMSVTMAFLAFIFFIKSQHQQQLPFRIQLISISNNIIAIAVLVVMKVLNIKLGIQLAIIFAVMIGFGISQLHFFNITFQLENVNKWTNSQIMMSYAAKLRKVLLNFHQYYYNTLFLGYIEIHQQKCDNQTCPLRILPVDDNKKQDRFEDIIRKIYNDGCKLSPVNPQLQLEYAIFHYQTGAKDKSMKLLLQIKWDDLSFDKYYKFTRLKNIIHRQMSQLINQQFLDLLSEIKVKDLEQQIIKKYQEAALLNLQFWSVLNEDHPDFKKLYQSGKSRVTTSQQVNRLYKQITQIAHSQRVTNLYIHYLNGIENDQKLFSQIYDNIRNQDGFDKKIIIQDWSNNCKPIMIVSIEQQNFATIIDLNTTCATLLGYERYDLLGKQIKTIFPDNLNSQIQNFIDIKVSRDGEEFFYLGHNNGYIIKINRKLQSFNSIETGLSLIITLQHKFIPNSGFIIFNNQEKVIGLSSSCLQIFQLQDNFHQLQIKYDEIFCVGVQNINDQKNILKFSQFINIQNRNLYAYEIQQQYVLNRTFNISKKDYNNFFILNFILIKSNRGVSKLQEQSDTGYYYSQNKFEFRVQMFHLYEQFQFVGCRQNDIIVNQIENQLQVRKKDDDETYRIQKYGQNITTLRLHENYIKVIELSESNSDDGENKSKASTNNELIKQTRFVSKGDEQKIFESRESYCSFIQNNTKKIYVRTGLFISIFLSIGMYIGLYFLTKTNYKAIYAAYDQLIFENEIIGQIAEAGRILIQTKYRLKTGDNTLDEMLLQSYSNRLLHLQNLASTYVNPYDMTVSINANQTQKFKSDEFILAFISQLSKINSQIKVNGGFDNFTLDPNSTYYIQFNSNETKSQMNYQIASIKKQAQNFSAKAIYISIFVNIGGITLSLILTMLLIYSLRNINLYKIQILSIFLETSQKDIQNYSQKTQNFLITLHVDESNQNNQNAEETNQGGKKGSSAMFAKKKIFKYTQFQKSPYFILGTFFLISSAYYVHSMIYSHQKESFLSGAIQYINIVSRYRETLSSQQTRIDKKLLDNFNATAKITDGAIANQVNYNYLQYERDFFSWHYQTYGIFDEYHKNLTIIFMGDICGGEIKIKYACDAGMMATNGSLLMLTDITIRNEQIDYSQILPKEYYYTMEAIKEAHHFILDNLELINSELFTSIYNNILNILMIWAVVVVILGILIEFYVQQVIVKNTSKIKNMLKFLPVSVAKKSEGIKVFIASILEQQGRINL